MYSQEQSLFSSQSDMCPAPQWPQAHPRGRPSCQIHAHSHIPCTVALKESYRCHDPCRKDRFGDAASPGPGSRPRVAGEFRVQVPGACSVREDGNWSGSFLEAVVTLSRRSPPARGGPERGAFYSSASHTLVAFWPQKPGVLSKYPCYQVWAWWWLPDSKGYIRSKLHCCPEDKLIRAI